MPYNYQPIVLVTCKKIGIKQKHCNKIKATSQGYITIVHTERIFHTESFPMAVLGNVINDLIEYFS